MDASLIKYLIFMIGSILIIWILKLWLWMNKRKRQLKERTKEKFKNKKIEN
jgi:hypothetical protein